MAVRFSGFYPRKCPGQRLPLRILCCSLVEAVLDADGLIQACPLSPQQGLFMKVLEPSLGSPGG